MDILSSFSDTTDTKIDTLLLISTIEASSEELKFVKNSDVSKVKNKIFSDGSNGFSDNKDLHMLRVFDKFSMFFTESLLICKLFISSKSNLLAS